MAVGSNPVLLPESTKIIAKQAIPEFTPSWNAYTGNAWYQAHRGTLAPFTASTSFANGGLLTMLGSAITTQQALQYWWLRTSGGVGGVWKW